MDQKALERLWDPHEQVLINNIQSVCEKPWDIIKQLRDFAVGVGMVKYGDGSFGDLAPLEKEITSYQTSLEAGDKNTQQALMRADHIPGYIMDRLDALHAGRQGGK